MIRPLDEALIDFQKTYRETFKQPLYEHEQYTKRQLIYNYAAVGSQFIYKTTQKELTDNLSNPRDIEDIISQWNDQSTKLQQISNQPVKKSEEPLSFQEQEELRSFRKQVQVLKKQKMIVKSRHERNIFFRKQIEILFKTKNLNMLSAEGMNSHIKQLKPYISYNSRNRGRKDRQGDRLPSRHNNEYRHSYGRKEEGRESHRRYDERDDSRRNQDRENQRKNDYYRQGQRRDDFSREKSRQSEQQREQSRKGDSFDRPQSFYSIKNPGSYYSPEQYSAQATPYSVPQFGRNDLAYGKYIPTIEISSSHNQNYQPGSYDQSYDQRIVYPPPQAPKSSSFYQQYDSNVNSQYNFRVSSTDVHKHYQDK